MAFNKLELIRVALHDPSKHIKAGHYQQMVFRWPTDSGPRVYAGWDADIASVFKIPENCFSRAKQKKHQSNW